MSSPRRRADAELVRRKLAHSREHAAQLIKEGRVTCSGMPVKKPASIVDPSAPLVVAESSEHEWASRGAHKLLGALAAFGPQGLDVAGKRCLDAGASTGGFTDVLLHNNASQVVGVDVGYGQMIWRLQNDERVVVMDRTNVRGIDAEAIGGAVDIVVSDLSFISLTLVLEVLHKCCTPDADLMLMVKPQFEVGKGNLGHGGVVRDPQQRVGAVLNVAKAALKLGMVVKGVAASPLPGPSGNVEYFLWLGAHVREGSSLEQDFYIVGNDDDAMSSLLDRVQQAVAEGPQ